MPHVTGHIPPPVAPRFLPGGPPAALAGGEPDPYAWMRNRDLPATRDYLAAERAYYDRGLDTGLRDELAAELTARVLAAGWPQLLHQDAAGAGVRAVLPGARRRGRGAPRRQSSARRPGLRR